MSHEAVLHGDAHGHDDHGHHEHHDTFLTKYVFSQDHKMIAKQFLITGIIWAVIGALMSSILISSTSSLSQSDRIASTIAFPKNPEPPVIKNIIVDQCFDVKTSLSKSNKIYHIIFAVMNLAEFSFSVWFILT